MYLQEKTTGQLMVEVQLHDPLLNVASTKHANRQKTMLYGSNAEISLKTEEMRRDVHSAYPQQLLHEREGWERSRVLDDLIEHQIWGEIKLAQKLLQKRRKASPFRTEPECISGNRKQSEEKYRRTQDLEIKFDQIFSDMSNLTEILKQKLALCT